jgi:hypothetical protein
VVQVLLGKVMLAGKVIVLVTYIWFVVVEVAPVRLVATIVGNQVVLVE